MHLSRLEQQCHDGGSLGARRWSFVSSIAQYQREVARAQAAQTRAHAAAQRDYARAQAAQYRTAAAYDREQKRLYGESRAAEVAAMNADLDAQLAALDGVLAATLGVDDKIDFASLKITPTLPAWQHRKLEVPEPQPALEQFLPAAPAGLNKVFGKGKHEQALAAAQAAHAQAIEIHRQREEWRVTTLAQARADHQAGVDGAHAEAAKQHAEVDQFEKEFTAGDADAIITYFTMVLEASAYPDGFPQKFKLAYVPESRQLVCEYDLPTVDVVPPVKAYKYVKTSDSITDAARPATQIKQLYASVVAQVTLRTVHELFEAD